jgi:hypothetical protein
MLSSSSQLKTQRDEEEAERQRRRRKKKARERRRIFSSTGRRSVDFVCLFLTAVIYDLFLAPCDVSVDRCVVNSVYSVEGWKEGSRCGGFCQWGDRGGTKMTRYGNGPSSFSGFPRCPGFLGSAHVENGGVLARDWKKEENGKMGRKREKARRDRLTRVKKSVTRKQRKREMRK